MMTLINKVLCSLKCFEPALNHNVLFGILPTQVVSTNGSTRQYYIPVSAF